MQKAGVPGIAGVTEASTTAPAGRDDDCDMAIDELGMPVDKKEIKSKGVIKVSASQNG